MFATSATSIARKPQSQTIEHSNSTMNGVAPPSVSDGNQFSDIPVELKEMVYEHFLRDTGWLDTLRPYLPAPCCTDKFEYLLAARVLLSKAGICMVNEADACLWNRWLSSIKGLEETSQSALRKAEVCFEVYPQEHPFMPNRYSPEVIARMQARYHPPPRPGGFTQNFLFLSRFRKLRELTITMQLDYGQHLSVAYNWYQGGYGTLGGIWSLTHKFVNRFQLLQLRSCTNLERVIFCASDVGVFPSILAGEGEFLDKVAVRIKRDYIRTHGRVLKVYFECYDDHWTICQKTPVGKISAKRKESLARY